MAAGARPLHAQEDVRGLRRQSRTARLAHHHHEAADIGRDGRDLPFVRPARGWFKQYNWVTAHFGPEDDVLAEMPTLRGWLKQSYVAVAPKKLGRMLE